jgi:hypothetical protein
LIIIEIIEIPWNEINKPLHSNRHVPNIAHVGFPQYKDGISVKSSIKLVFVKFSLEDEVEVKMN